MSDSLIWLRFALQRTRRALGLLDHYGSMKTALKLAKAREEIIQLREENGMLREAHERLRELGHEKGAE